MLWLKAGVVHWTFHIRAGQSRTVGYPADSPALKDLLVVCECGVRWTPTPLPDGDLPEAPLVAGVLIPIAPAA